MRKLVFILGVGFSISILLNGCNPDLPNDPLVKNEVIQRMGVVNEDSQEDQKQDVLLLDILGSVKKVSVISPEGSDIDLEIGPWFDEFKTYLKVLEPSYQSLKQYDYTVVLWTAEGDPYVIQIDQEGINIGGRKYSSPHIEEMMKVIRSEVGKQFFVTLSVDYITIFTMDTISNTTVLKEEEMNLFITELKEAEYVEESPMIRHPLYPHYVIQLMVGGKSVLNLDVMGNNLLCLSYGEEQYFYQVQENIYQQLYDLFPPFTFTDENPKSLFGMSAIEIKYPSGEPSLQIGSSMMESIQAESITNSFVRLLNGGKVEEAFPSDDLITTLIFLDSEQRKEVEIYTDGYFYMDQYYHLPRVGEMIDQHVQSLLH